MTSHEENKNSASVREELGELAQQFNDSAQLEFPEASPLYARLCANIATDEDIMEMASHGRRHPKVLLFLGAVHFLLLEGAQHPLRDFYPSLVQSPRPAGQAYPF